MGIIHKQDALAGGDMFHSLIVAACRSGFGLLGRQRNSITGRCTKGIISAVVLPMNKLRMRGADLGHAKLDSCFAPDRTFLRVADDEEAAFE